MSDLGQDRESLEVNLLEIEHSIEQSRLAKKAIELDRARMAVKLKTYERSFKEIDEKILEHEKNAKSLRDAISKMKG